MTPPQCGESLGTCICQNERCTGIHECQCGGSWSGIPGKDNFATYKAKGAPHATPGDVDLFCRCGERAEAVSLAHWLSCGDPEVSDEWAQDFEDRLAARLESSQQEGEPT